MFVHGLNITIKTLNVNEIIFAKFYIINSLSNELNNEIMLKLI